MSAGKRRLVGLRGANLLLGGAGAGEGGRTMNINEMLQQTGAAEAISRELGVDPATAEAGAAALLPSILSGFQDPVTAGEAPAESSAFPGLGSLGGLLGTFGSLGGAGLLENATSSAPTDVGKGNQILGQIFGSKEG